MAKQMDLEKIQAQVARLREKLAAAETAAAVAENPEVAEARAALAKAEHERGRCNQRLALRRKGLATAMADVEAKTEALAEVESEATYWDGEIERLNGQIQDFLKAAS